MAVILCVALLLVARLASAQVSVEPESPRWGTTFTIADTDGLPREKIARSDSAFAVF